MKFVLYNLKLNIYVFSSVLTSIFFIFIFKNTNVMAAMSNIKTMLTVKINVNQNIDDLNISSFKFIDMEKTINIFSNRLNNEKKIFIGKSSSISLKYTLF